MSNGTKKGTKKGYNNCVPNSALRRLAWWGFGVEATSVCGSELLSNHSTMPAGQISEPVSSLNES